MKIERSPISFGIDTTVTLLGQIRSDPELGGLETNQFCLTCRNLREVITLQKGAMIEVGDVECEMCLWVCIILLHSIIDAN